MIVRAVASVLQQPGTPTVTIVVAAAQLALFFRPMNIDIFGPLSTAPISSVSLQPRQIVERLQLSRLLTAGVIHVDEYHVCYNMASLLYKGAEIERERGSPALVAILVAAYLISSIVYVALALALFLFTPFTDVYTTTNTVGFSGVLFALKVVLTHNKPADALVQGPFGITMPVRYAAWAELIYIHLFVPQSSFLGHLAGIITGFIVVYGEKPFRAWYRASSFTPFSGVSNTTDARDEEELERRRRAHYSGTRYTGMSTGGRGSAAGNAGRPSSRSHYD